MSKWIAGIFIILLVSAPIAGMCQAKKEFDQRSVCLLTSYAGNSVTSSTAIPAICVDDEGYFISGIRPDHKLFVNNIVIYPGTSTEQTIKVSVVRTDRKTGLALYKSVSKPIKVPVADMSFTGEMKVRDKMIAYILDNNDKKAVLKPVIAQNVIITAADHMKMSSQKNDAYSNTVVTTYDVNYKPKEVIESVPIVNEAGQLICLYNDGGEAVIRRDSEEDKIVNHQVSSIALIRHQLLTPVIDIDMSALTPEKKSIAQEYPVTIKFFGGIPTDLTLEVTLSFMPGFERTFVAQRITPDSFQVKASLIDENFNCINIKRSDSSSESIYTGDRLINADNKLRLLSELHAIIWDEKRDKYYCTDRSYNKIIGDTRSYSSVKGLENITGSVNGIAGHFDLSKSPQLIISPADIVINDYTLHAVLSSGGKVLSELTQQNTISKYMLTTSRKPYDMLSFSLAPPPSSVLNDVLEINLPAPASDTILAGNGQYLVMRLPSIHMLAVYGVEQRKTWLINVENNDICLAVGKDAILWVDNVTHVLYCKQFSQLDYTPTHAKLDDKEPVLAAAISSNYSGMIMLLRTKHVSFYSLNSIKMAYDINGTVKPADFKVPEIPANYWHDGNWAAKVNAKGDVFTIYDFNSVVMVSAFAYKYINNEWVCISSSGNDDKFEGPWEGDDVEYTGIKESAFFIGLDKKELYWNSYRTPPKYLRVAILTRYPIQVLTDLPPLLEIGRIKDHPPIHFYFFPENNLIITMPATADKLILRRFNITEVLRTSKVDYLIVTTTPKAIYTPGKAYQYQIGVESKRGGVKYQLDAAPAGMKVSTTGLISWKPSATQKGDEVIIVSITDDSGQRIFQSYLLQQVVTLL